MYDEYKINKIPTAAECLQMFVRKQFRASSGETCTDFYPFSKNLFDLREFILIEVIVFAD
jgi:hypothetical protein